jgi:hypothetical protein
VRVLRVSATLAVLVALLAAGLAGAGTAAAAQLIGRNATGVSIKTNAKGEALFTYHQGSTLKRTLVWGAINARTPSPNSRQVEFKVDYSGGWRTHHSTKFSGTCGRYDGPPLANLVAACKAADGSYWAAQSWARPLPNLGFTPWAADLRQKWLEVSHWTGEIAQFETGANWVYSGRFQSIFGRLTYRGQPVYGYGTTRFGAPTDGFGRLVYLDTLNSTYGPGWKRENSFVPHNPTGVFCYGFYSFDPTKGGYRHPPGYTARRGPGTGEKYRLTASGPGVTPNVELVIDGGHPFDKSNPDDVAFQQSQTELLQSWGDKGCGAGLS